MSAGIMYVAFGKEYDKCAAHALRESRKATDLPFFVCTNLSSSQRHPVWSDVPDVQFRLFDKPTRENRTVKTQATRVTPFDLTLYLDCDTVVQHPCEVPFMFLKGTDMAFFYNQTFPDKRGKILRIYKNAVEETRATYPLRVWQGGCFAFRKNRRVEKFFRLWNHLWREFGSGREMPALAVTVQKIVKNWHLKIKRLPPNFFASFANDPKATVQHGFNSTVRKRIGIPEFEQWHPFDEDPTAFRWVDV